MHQGVKLGCGIVFVFLALTSLFGFGTSIAQTNGAGIASGGFLLLLFGIPATLLFSSYGKESRKRQKAMAAFQQSSAASSPQPLQRQQMAQTGQLGTVESQPVTNASQCAPPPPQQPQAPVLPESVLGRKDDTPEVVRLSQLARRQGMYVIGKNGTGKTTFLVNLILQDIQADMGLCFIDPHGDAITDILLRLPPQRQKDVILLDVLETKYPFGLNLFECADPTDLELAARSCEQVMHVFEKVWGADSKNPSWGPAMEDLLRNIALTFIQYQGLTLAEVPFVLTEEIARDKIVGRLKSNQLRLFWNQFARRKDKNEYMASTLNKVRAFLSNPIVENVVGQSHTTVNFRTIMDEGKILLVKLPGRYEDISSLVGGVLIGQLLNAALSRVDTPAEKRRQFNLYVDEYQNFCTPDMATILAECRKFSLATTICHQFLDQLDSVNRGATLNAANMVVFRISGLDGEELAKEFDATPPPPEIVSQRSILSPKREVIDHLLKNGHSNPEYAPFTHKWLVFFTEALGMKFDRPSFHQTDNLIAIARQYHAGKQYRNAVYLQTDLKIVVQRYNNFFYEVMRDRDAAKPLDEKDFITVMQVAELYDLIKYPDLIRALCSPDGALIQQGIQRVGALTQGKPKKIAQAEMVINFVTTIRQLMGVLAADPIMVDSGQHEPIYDKPRTYADVQNQIATDLANLLPFHAKCKLGHTELVLQTLPLAPGVDDVALQQRIAAIQQTTQSAYGKARSLVEEEITTRQEQLIEPEEKKRKTTGEDVI